jgi:hypothetical protein
MRRSFLLSTAALAGALALGCADQQHPMASADVAPTPSLVERTTEHFGLGFDTEQYTVVTGATAENWEAFCATGAENWDAFNILTVTRPDGSQKQTWQANDVHVLIWNLPADVCAESPDYTGTARLVNTDSDVDLSGHGADATGFTTRGTVTDGSGQQYHFLLVARFTVAPDITLDNFVFEEDFIQRVVKVQLTPFGR